MNLITENSMETLLTPPNITFALGLLAIIFSVYNYFRNPQEALDKREALNQKDIDGRASLLAQQLQWEKEATEKRFVEMGIRITESMTLAQNHIHTVDTKVDAISKSMSGMSNEITRLATIIEERIPKK